MSFKEEYFVEALSCPECANNIIENLEKMNFVDEVHIDYDKKKITIIGKKSLSKEQVNEVIQGILADNHCEEHNYGHLHNIVTEEFNFDDIDCPNCAMKVERALNKQNNILDAQVNFINKKIIIKHLNNVEVYDVVSKIVSRVENGAKVFKNDKQHSEEHSHEHHHEDGFKCDCCGHHHEEESEKKNIIGLIILVAGIALYLVSIGLNFYSDLKVLTKILFIISYLFIGYDILYGSLKGIIHGDIFNENFLMIIASLGALIVNEPIEGIMVILLYKFGEKLQDHATEKSKNSIQSLLELKSDIVTLENGEIRNVKDVNVGDIITIKVGEKIPLDGVIKGEGTDVDMKALTGESRPVYIDEGSEILSGAINLSKVVKVEVTKEDSESTISKMLKLVEEASNQKSHTEQFITKFARFYTPCVLIVAFIIGLLKYFVFDEQLVNTMNDVFSILVISCPCALVISIPLGYFAGIGKLSSLGILVKGGNYLDALANSSTFVFDKTGTITKGNFKVCEINPVEGVKKEDVLAMIAEAEKYSNHPIAQSILQAYGNNTVNDEDTNIEEISGYGLKLTKNNKDNNKDIILVGNKNLMKINNIEIQESNSIGTILYLSCNNKYLGNVVIRDEVKETSKKLINQLNKSYNTFILTGDTKDVSDLIGKEVGIKNVESELLPKQKYESLKKIISNAKLEKSRNNLVCYVGDGINDSPALKIADVGIAMGGAGSDAAKETADIVIMNDDLMKIDDAIKVSKYTKVIIIQNIFLALSIKVAALIIGILGVLGSYAMLIAVFADVGVCLLAILNTLRIMNVKKTKKMKKTF